MSLDEKVRDYLSRMQPGTEIDARGLARAFGGAEPLAVDYALSRAQKAGFAISEDGKWFGPAPGTTHHARKKGASARAEAATPKKGLPRYDPRRGWIGGDKRTLYTFTDRSTHLKVVHPGGGAGKKVLANMGPEMDVRVASHAEAEDLWQKPLHSGWTVYAHATKKHYRPEASKKSHAQIKREVDEILADGSGTGGSGTGPRILKISRGTSFADRRSFKVDVQYPGEAPMHVEFVGPSRNIVGPVVLIMGATRHQVPVHDAARFGAFGPDWIRRFYA